MLRSATFSFVAILEISNHPFLIACCDHKRRVAMCLALPAPSLEKKACAEVESRYNCKICFRYMPLSQHASCRKKHAREGYGNLSTGMAVDTAPVSEMQFQLKLNVLLLAPVVRHDAFYALLFCLAVCVYVYFSPHLSRGSTGRVGVGGGGGGGVGGGLNSVLSPCSCCIFVST